MKTKDNPLHAISGETALPWLAACCAALLAGWMVWQAHGTINSDGILYVEVARLFSLGQWQEGLKLYNWPLYPLLIALVHQITGLGLQTSAHLLAILAFALTSSGLVVLVREAGGDGRTMRAALLLLFASPYLVGDVLPMVVRDQLFWAAHVWNLVFFLRFYRGRTLGQAVRWGASAMLAVLFRIEAITHLLLLPAVLLADSGYSWRARWAHFFKAHVLLLLVLAGIALAFATVPALHAEHLGRLLDPLAVLQRVYGQFSQGLDSKAQLFAEQVLGSFLKDYAMAGLLLTLGYALLAKTLGSAGWLQLAVALGGRMLSGFSRPVSFNRVFVWLIVLGVLNGVFILLANFLLPKRLLLPVGFIILVYAAFGLQALHAQWRARLRAGFWLRAGFPVFMIALALQFLAIVWPRDPQKMPALQAAQWLKSHAPPHARIYYDTRRIRYYATGDASDRTEDPWPVVQDYFESGKIRQFDYAVVRVSDRSPERQAYLTQRAGASPMASFGDGRGHMVLIYRINH